MTRKILLLLVFLSGGAGWSGAITPPPPSGSAASGIDSAGNLYASFIGTTTAGYAVKISKLAPHTTKPLWTQTFSLGSMSVPGGIAVDPAGNSYVPVNDLGASVSAVVKFDTNGVLISSQPTPYQGPAFSPLITDIGIDTVNAHLYVSETFTDPNHYGLNSVLVMNYSPSFALINTRLISDGPSIGDSGSGMRIDGAGVLTIGVTETIAGNQYPIYQAIRFSPGLGQILSRNTVSQPVDVICIDCVSVVLVSGDGQQGPPNSALPQPLVIQATFIFDGSPANGSFQIISTPPGSTTESLSSSGDFDPNTGLTSTSMTLGEVPGNYQVQGGCFGCINNVVTFNETAQQNMNLTIRLAPNVPPSKLDNATLSPTPVIVHASDSLNNPVPNQTVNITAQAVQNSGGHDGPAHGGSRPAGTFAGGSCTPDLTQCSITCTTNTNGDCVVSGGGVPVYNASAFGGQETLTAQAAAVSATATLTVAVPSLQSFPPVPSLFPFTQWILKGQTASSCGASALSIHPSNHWTTPGTQNAIAAALEDFYIASGPDNAHRLQVQINDMSLPSGGLFDICGQWAPSHHCHRTGEAVDINTGNLGGMDSDTVELLTSYMNNHNGLQIVEGSSLHYQFPGIEIQRPGCQPR